MYNLLHIYDCPKCGKILSDQVIHGSEFDIENDEEYAWVKCDKCGSDVEQRKIKNEETGQMMDCFEEVDEERARWSNGFYNGLFDL